MKKLSIVLAAIAIVVLAAAIIYFMMWLAIIIAIVACIDILLTKKPWGKIHFKKRSS